MNPIGVKYCQFMTQSNPKIKPAPKDWHKADIKAALEKAGWTLRALARHHGLGHTATTEALSKPYPAAERRIAGAIGVHPWEIWPSRYDADGNPNRSRGRPRSDANRATPRRNGKDRRSR